MIIWLNHEFSSSRIDSWIIRSVDSSKRWIINRIVDWSLNLIDNIISSLLLTPLQGYMRQFFSRPHARGLQWGGQGYRRHRYKCRLHRRPSKVDACTKSRSNVQWVRCWFIQDDCLVNDREVWKSSSVRPTKKLSHVSSPLVSSKP